MAFTRSPQRATNPAYKKVFKYKLSLFFWLLQGALNGLQTQHIKKFLNINYFFLQKSCPIIMSAYKSHKTSLIINQSKIDTIRSILESLPQGTIAERSKHTLYQNVYYHLIENEAPDDVYVFEFFQENYKRFKKKESKSINLLSIPTKLRNILMGSHCNIDVVNCHPSIILGIINKHHLLVKHNYLKQYVENRADLCKELNLTKAEIKKTIMKPIYGGSNSGATGILKEINDQIKNIVNFLYGYLLNNDSDFSKIYYNFITSNKKKNYNIEGKVFSMYIQYLETKILNCLLEDTSMYKGVLPLHDGILIQTTEFLALKQTIPMLQKNIKEKTGFPLLLSFSSSSDPADDPQDPPHNIEEVTEVETINKISPEILEFGFSPDTEHETSKVEVYDNNEFSFETRPESDGISKIFDTKEQFIKALIVLINSFIIKDCTNQIFVKHDHL